MARDHARMRGGLTSDQRALLDHIWEAYYRSNGNTWPAVFETQIALEQPRVLAAIAALPRGCVYEEGDQYQIGLLGALLTTSGGELEQRLVAYLDHVRAAKKKDLGLVTITSQGTATALTLNEEETMMLGSALHIGRLAGDKWIGGPSWAAGIPREMAALMTVKRSELEAFVRDRADRQAADLAAARTPPKAPSVFWFVAASELRSQVERDWDELRRVDGVQASKSCVLLSGGILEGMLLDVLTQEEERAREAFTALNRKPATSLDRWDLVDLINVARALGIIPESASHLSQALREFRNLVHPGKQLRDQVQLTPEDAALSVSIVETCIVAISAYEEIRSPSQFDVGPA